MTISSLRRGNEVAQGEEGRWSRNRDDKTRENLILFPFRILGWNDQKDQKVRNLQEFYSSGSYILYLAAIGGATATTQNCNAMGFHIASRGYCKLHRYSSRYWLQSYDVPLLRVCWGSRGSSSGQAMQRHYWLGFLAMIAISMAAPPTCHATAGE